MDNIKTRDRVNKGKPIDTLLSEFIKKKEKLYIIPQRKGMAKGEPIGFSKAKYEASLRFLYRNKLKDIATTFNISYGVLRRWAIEESFTQAVQETREDFAGHFVNILKQKLNSWYQDTHEVYSISPQREIFLIPSPQIDIAVFADYEKYDALLRQITENKIIMLLNQPEMSRYILIVINFFKTLNRGKKDPEIGLGKIIGELRKTAGRLIVKELLNIATTPAHNDCEERKYISYAAQVLEDWVVHKTFSEWEKEQSFQ